MLRNAVMAALDFVGGSQSRVGHGGGKPDPSFAHSLDGSMHIQRKSLALGLDQDAD